MVCEWVKLRTQVFVCSREADVFLSDEEPLLPHRNVVPRDSGATSVADATQLDVDSGQVPSNTIPTSSSAREAKNSGPHRRRRRVRIEGSDLGRPGVVGAAIQHDLTLFDSSDDDAPFTVLAAPRARPSRRLVLVPGSKDATPQSTEDREWIAEACHRTRFSPRKHLRRY